MAKKELTLEQALAELEAQKHLAEAVAAKDNEIAKLKLDLAQANKTVREQQHLAAAVQNKDNEIIALKSENVELKRLQANQNGEKENLESKLESIEKQLKETTEHNKTLVEIANGYITNFRSYLKSIQGGLEVAVELEALLSEKLNKKP